MSENKEKIKVLFLCTGNTCRSQIAQGWVRHLKGDIMDAYSAGISPAHLNQTAVKVMAEAGVDISKQYSKHVDELKGIDFDYVVTVCDYARDQCPTLTGKAKHIHKLFTDPSFMPGNDEEILIAFRKLRDDIKEFIQTMPKSLEDRNR